MSTDSTRPVYSVSNTMFTQFPNGAFTLKRMKEQKDQVTERALKIAKGKGWNQVEFAAEIGVDKQHITNWLARGMPGNRYAAVAKKLGVKVEQLLGDEAALEAVADVIAAAKINEPSISAYQVKVTPEAMLFAAEWAKLPQALRAQVSALVHMMVAELARGGPGSGAKGPKTSTKSQGRHQSRPDA